jgi:Cu-processing system permease protein
MRARETLLVAAREVREAVRSRWFLLSAASFLVLSLGLSLLGLAGAQRSGLAGFDRTTAGLLNLALLFVPLVTLCLGSLGLAGEMEDGSLAVLLAQPLSRGEVYLGKYLGLLGAVGASIFAGFGASGLIIGALAGGGNAMAFLQLVGLAVLLAAATLALGTVLSAAFSSRAKAVGGAFAAWMIVVYASDLGTIGLVAARSLSPGQVFALALFNPVEQARVLGTLALTNRADVLGVVGIYGQDLLGASGLPFLLIAALFASGACALGFGWALFRKAVV